MRALLWIIAIFAVAAGVAMLASSNQGYVLLVLPPWRAQVSLNLVVVALVVGFIGLYVLLRLISKTLDLPGRVSRYRARRRQQKASTSMNHAVRAYFEGRLVDSLKSARQAYSAGGKMPEAAIIAARAAHGLHDDKQYREWLERAEASRDGRAARLLTEAELAIERKEFTDAQRILNELLQEGYRSALQKRLELVVAQELHEWDRAIELVRELQAVRALTPAQARDIIRHARVEAFRNRLGDETALQEYWRALPREELNDAVFMERLVPVLASVGRGPLARKAVERLLDRGWNAGLARRYALCVEQVDEAKDALSRTEKWLSAHPDDAGLLYTLGRQCMIAQIWGKSQSYLEESSKREPRADVFLALAQLMEQLERPEEANQYYRRAAEYVSRS